DADPRRKTDLIAIRFIARNPDVAARREPALQPLGDPLDVQRLRAVESERLRALARLELERHHAHSHEGRPVDPLVALGDDRLHPGEGGPPRPPTGPRPRPGPPPPPRSRGEPPRPGTSWRRRRSRASPRPESAS